MHNRIYQLTPEPVNADQYITESDFYDHWFVGSIADYVSDNCNKKADIERLGNRKGYRVASDEFGAYLEVYSKEEYFAAAFARFSDALESIKNCTLSDFARGLDMWHLKDSYEEKFGDYVYASDDASDDDDSLMTFDAFVRNAAEGQKYYIGGTVDYHW